MKIPLILFLCLFPLSAAAICKDWSDTDTVLAASFTTVQTLDYLQTRSFLRDPERRESNPIIGPRPSYERLAILNLLTLAAVLGSACYLDVPFRRALLGGAITIELLTVVYNRQVDMRIVHRF